MFRRADSAVLAALILACAGIAVLAFALLFRAIMGS